MKRTLLIAVPVLIAGVLFVMQSFTSKSSSADIKEFNIPAFTAIELDGAFNVQFTQSETPSAKVEASAADLEQIAIEVKNEVLRVKMKPNHKYKDVRIQLSTPQLKKVAMSGSGNFRTTNALTAPELMFSLAGSGNVDADMSTNEVKVAVAGSGNVNFSGTTKKFKVDIAGSGNVKANKLKSSAVKADVAGSGSAYVWVGEELNASVAGSGSIYYSGDPKNVQQNIAGSGTVQRKEN